MRRRTLKKIAKQSFRKNPRSTSYISQAKTKGSTRLVRRCRAFSLQSRRRKRERLFMLNEYREILKMIESYEPRDEAGAERAARDIEKVKSVIAEIELEIEHARKIRALASWAAKVKRMHRRVFPSVVGGTAEQAWETVSEWLELMSDGVEPTQ